MESNKNINFDTYFEIFDINQEISYEEISLWLNKVFEIPFIRENFSITLLWIFSQLRISKDDAQIRKICLCCYEFLKNNLAGSLKEFNEIQDCITSTEHRLIKILKILPSIETCLTDNERKSVLSKISSFELTDDCFNFKDTEQFKNLDKIRSVTSVNSFLDNYEKLLDISTKSGSGFGKKIGSIVQYIITVDDVIADGIGLLGIVDDVYALGQLYDQQLSEGDENLKWEFELKYPNFRYPILVSENGQNLFNKADFLLKSSILKSDDEHKNLRLIKASLPKNFAIISSILSTVTDIKLSQKSLNNINPYKLEVDQVYELSKDGETICAKFKKIKEVMGSDFFFFEFKRKKTRYAGAGRMERSISLGFLNRCALSKSNKSASDHNTAEKFLDAANIRDIKGIYPFQASEGVEYDLKKSALVCPKNTFEHLSNIYLEGRPIIDWFGQIYIDTKGKVKKTSGIFGGDPLLIHTTDVNQLLGYLDENEGELKNLQTINYVIKNEPDLGAANELRRIAKNVGVNIFLENSQKKYERNLIQEGYKLVKDKKPSTELLMPRENDTISHYLSKLGTVSKVSYRLFSDPIIEEYKKLITNIERGNSEIDFIRKLLKQWVDKQNLRLRGTDKDLRLEKFEKYLEKLTILRAHDDSIPELLEFIRTNIFHIKNFSKEDEIEKWCTENNSVHDKVLISNKDLRIMSLQNKFDPEKFISFFELEKSTTVINKLFIPSILDPKLREIIATSNFASEIEVLVFPQDKVRLEKAVKYFRGDGLTAEIKDKNKALENIFADDITYASPFSEKISSLSRDELTEAIVIEFENGKMLPLPLQSAVISSPTVNELTVNLKKKTVSEIEFGDYIMVTDTQGGAITDYIIDQTVPQIESIRIEANLWKNALSEFMKIKDMDYKDVSKHFDTFGLRRDPLTIKAWLNNEHLIAPDSIEGSLTKLGKILEMEEKQINSCIKNCKRIYSLRRRVIDEILELLEHPYVENEQIFFDYNGKNFNFKFFEVAETHKDIVDSKSLYHII